MRFRLIEDCHILVGQVRTGISCVPEHLSAFGIDKPDVFRVQPPVFKAGVWQLGGFVCRKARDIVCLGANYRFILIFGRRYQMAHSRRESSVFVERDLVVEDLIPGFFSLLAILDINVRSFFCHTGQIGALCPYGKACAGSFVVNDTDRPCFRLAKGRHVKRAGTAEVSNGRRFRRRNRNRAS